MYTCVLESTVLPIVITVIKVCNDREFILGGSYDEYCYHFTISFLIGNDDVHEFEQEFEFGREVFQRWLYLMGNCWCIMAVKF